MTNPSPADNTGKEMVNGVVYGGVCCGKDNIGKTGRTGIGTELICCRRDPADQTEQPRWRRRFPKQHTPRKRRLPQVNAVTLPSSLPQKQHNVRISRDDVAEYFLSDCDTCGQEGHVYYEGRDAAAAAYKQAQRDAAAHRRDPDSNPLIHRPSEYPDDHLWRDGLLSRHRDERRGALAEGVRAYGVTPQEAIDNTNARALEIYKGMGLDPDELPLDKRGKPNLAQMLNRMTDSVNAQEDSGLPGKRAHLAGLEKAAQSEPDHSGYLRDKTANLRREIARQEQGANPGPVDTDTIAERLRAIPAEASSRDQVEKDLYGLSKSELREVADKMGIPLPADATTTDVKERIQRRLQSRRDSAILRNPENIGPNPLLERIRGQEEREKLAADRDSWAAKRRDLAALDEAVANERDISVGRQLSRQAADLRAQIGRHDRGEDVVGKVNQPREVTKQQILDTYAKLIKRPNEYVSLVKIRGNMPHVAHDEMDAALKELDRARLIQLDPDSNQKAIPKEGWDAAVTLGGEQKHFISSPNVRPAKPAPATPASSPTSGWDAEQVARQLDELTSVPAGKETLKDASKVQLLELAAAVGLRAISGDSRETLIQRIVYMTIGAKGAYKRAAGEL
jgi:hypothetical protein